MEGDHGIGAGLKSLAPVPARPSLRAAGRYRIEALLGRGGVGSVHRAYDTARERYVAFKRLQHADEVAQDAASGHESRKSARQRAQIVTLFQREYHMLAQLEHPRIIEVYDYGVDELGPFYTMELLEGHDLAKSAPLPWLRTCEVLRDVASALTLLHSRRMLHRDISPRNVHIAPDGRAKLIDFGSMTPFGASEVLVGTPAFVPPEAVLRQSLDARSDLYSLGALGYFLLTGRSAYAAQSFAALRDAHRSQPLPPSTYAPDVGRPLEALIMQLISMDRGARPASAVELVERLNAIGRLEHDPRLAVASAYLTTPALVGRNKELIAVRRRALRAVRGRGASVIVGGTPGVGRSRFLDACALEGKLAGMLVLRGAPGAAGGVHFGVMRSLLLQLHAALGDAERRACEPPPHLRTRLAPGLTWTRANSKPVSMRPAPPDSDDPGALVQTLHGYLAELAAQRPLMILIDDFQLIDEPSAAVIASLAPLAPRARLVIVAAYAAQAQLADEGALRLLRGYSRLLTLAPLQMQEIEALLGSVFGAVVNLAPLAHRLHALCAGKPRLCMELAQHLVDARVIRYENGGFALPEMLAVSDLPDSLEAALGARCDRLSRPARTLGAVVALCAGSPLSVDQCMTLAEQHDRGAGERALGELIATQLVGVEDEHLALRQAGFGGALLAGVDKDEQQQLHARIAALFALDPALRACAAQHYFEAGDDAAGLQLLVAESLDGRLSYEWFSGYDELLERALVACKTLGRSARDAFMLRRARVLHNAHFLEPYAPEAFLAFVAELYEMSGLQHWQAQGDAVDPQTRLTRALQHAAERYDRAPELERIHPPQEAIAELARSVAAISAYATSTFNLALLERLPSMEPYVALSPAIQVMEWIVCAMRDLRTGRHAKYMVTMHRVLARMEEPDRAGLTPREFQVARLSILYAIGLSDAALGDARAFSRADELDAMPSMRISAWRVRHSAHLHRGHGQQAEGCRRQLELLLIQHGAMQGLRGTTLETESMCYAYTDDALNLRRLLPELESMAAKHEGWVPVLLIARAELERMRGQLASARALHEQCFALIAPGRHGIWPYAAGFYARLLIEQGELEQARAFAADAVAEVERGEMGVLGNGVIAELAVAEALLGDLAGATTRLDQLLSGFERQGVAGMFAGLRHEQRAMLAVMARDAEAFSHHLERCRAHFAVALDSPFSGRVVRLITAARRTGLGLTTEEPSDSALAQAAVQRLERELGLCVDPDERAERALSLLIEASGAQGGHLFGMQDAKLARLASLRAEQPSETLRVQLAALLARVNQADEEATQIISTASLLPAVTVPVVEDAGGHVYHPFPVAGERASERVFAVVALVFEPGARKAPPRELLAAVAKELLTRGDVTAMTLMR